MINHKWQCMHCIFITLFCTLFAYIKEKKKEKKSYYLFIFNPVFVVRTKPGIIFRYFPSENKENHDHRP